MKKIKLKDLTDLVLKNDWQFSIMHQIGIDEELNSNTMFDIEIVKYQDDLSFNRPIIKLKFACQIKNNTFIFCPYLIVHHQNNKAVNNINGYIQITNLILNFADSLDYDFLKEI